MLESYEGKYAYSWAHLKARSREPRRYTVVQAPHTGTHMRATIEASGGRYRGDGLLIIRRGKKARHLSSKE
jgi:hypothetical protein